MCHYSVSRNSASFGQKTQFKFQIGCAVKLAQPIFLTFINLAHQATKLITNDEISMPNYVPRKKLLKIIDLHVKIKFQNFISPKCEVGATKFEIKITQHTGSYASHK